MIDVVVGGLYGSEAKGHVTQRLVERRLVETEPLWNIRIGGPNAGHTGHDTMGNPVAFRQVPVGVLVPGEVNLEIGAGSEIDLPVLLDEIDLCRTRGYLEGKRLLVHGEATLITDRHKKAESDLVGAIGSTGKGIGAARADRLLRGAERLQDNQAASLALLDRGVEIPVTDHGDWRGDRANIIIEGVQGYALGLHAGYYPQCTTSDCRAVDFLSMAGISPWDVRYTPWGSLDLTVWVVARMFPIRVAGNSGPLRNETTWAELGLPIERTTVTQKVRRVGAPDWDLVKAAVTANGGPGNVALALSMVDQMFPEVRDLRWVRSAATWAEAEQYIRTIENHVDVDVEMVLTGPNTGSFRKVRR